MIIEHLMKVLMSICDRMMIIHLGGKVCIAPPNIVAKDNKVIEIYLGAEYVGN